MSRLLVAILMIFTLSGVCLADGLDEGPPSFFHNLVFGTQPDRPEQQEQPTTSPDIPPTPPPRPPDLPPPGTPSIDTPGAEVPYLDAFLVVYEGKWIAVFNDGVQKYSVNISRTLSTCTSDETQCCGVLRANRLNSDTILFKGSFCLSSTYEIHLKDSAGGLDIMCMGVKGARVGIPLHPFLPGYTLDDPVLIDCGFFRLVRPE